MKYGIIEGADRLPYRAFQRINGRMTLEGGGSKQSSSPSTTTSIQKSEPPAFVRPYSTELMERGAALSQTPYSPYQGQKIADIAPETLYGLNMTAERAVNGSPVMNATQQNMAATMNGDYMSPDSNPYLKANVNQALGDVQTRVNSQFNNANYGTTAHQETLARSLGDQANQLYGANYSNERTNQMRGAMFAPQLAQADYADASALTGVGDAYRSLEQESLNQSLADWTEAQQDPYKKMDTLASTISTASGGYANSSSSAPNPYQTSPVAGMIGGGMAGYGLGQMAGMNPYMSAGGGALMGGLLA
jgi:hypothetical protein